VQARPVPPRLVAVAQDYGDASDKFEEMVLGADWGYSTHFALTKAGRHTLHVNLACCGGLQAAFAFSQAPITGTGMQPYALMLPSALLNDDPISSPRQQLVSLMYWSNELPVFVVFVFSSASELTTGLEFSLAPYGVPNTAHIHIHRWARTMHTQTISLPFSLSPPRPLPPPPPGLRSLCLSLARSGTRSSRPVTLLACT